MKVAIYARVSTDEQTEQNQLPTLIEMANQRGYEIFGIYREKGSAWTAGHQKELARLFEDGRKGKFQVVLVFALNRLTREGPLEQLLQWRKFKEYGIKLISRGESFTEYPNEMVEVMLALVAWQSKADSDRKSVAVKAGMIRAAAQGVHCGRPRKPAPSSLK